MEATIAYIEEEPRKERGDFYALTALGRDELKSAGIYSAPGMLAMPLALIKARQERIMAIEPLERRTLLQVCNSCAWGPLTKSEIFKLHTIDEANLNGAVEQGWLERVNERNANDDD